MVTYKEMIVGTAERRTFLHRCFRDCLDDILREGLGTDGNLLSTATAQPFEVEDAINIYHNGRDHGDSVAVIHIPRELWETASKKAKGCEVTTKEIGYFHPRIRMFTVHPKFVVAWINRKTDNVHFNPYLDRKPAEGYEEFDYMLG